jgi:hypothetical protein
LRNRDHAHSDPEGRSVSVEALKIGGEVLAFPSSRDAFAPLSREMMERVAELIERLRVKLAEEHIRIQGNLDAGERF